MGKARLHFIIDCSGMKCMNLSVLALLGGSSLLCMVPFQYYRYCTVFYLVLIADCAPRNSAVADFHLRSKFHIPITAKPLHTLPTYR